MRVFLSPETIVSEHPPQSFCLLAPNAQDFAQETR